MMFEIPAEGRRHAIDARDAARALGEAATRPGVSGRTFMIGGGRGWRLTHARFMGDYLCAVGLDALPEDAYAPGLPGQDDAWYMEGLDGDRRRAGGPRLSTHLLWRVSRRRASLGRGQRPALRPFRRLICGALLGLSPYHGREAPERQSPIESRIAAVHRPPGTSVRATVVTSADARDALGGVGRWRVGSMVGVHGGVHERRAG